MLCHVMLYVLLCHVMSCYAMLCITMLSGVSVVYMIARVIIKI